ncbi:MAG: hypothetical protein PHO10_00520 [Gemmiger sp.]|nr:hypothetical protein [Gemmiger sp.]
MHYGELAWVRGFNYQPGYGSTSYENWRYFDSDAIARELANGKRCFPRINTIRLWLSFGAWQRDPAGFAAHFEALLAICAGQGLRAVPCLFNRWHNAFCDNDGLYLDDFAPGAPAHPWRNYLEAVLTAHRQDSRVLLWDLCNEPFACHQTLRALGSLADAEQNFLRQLASAARGVAPCQPLGISLSGQDIAATLPLTAELCDVLLIHPYWMHGADPAQAPAEKQQFLQQLDAQVAFARRADFPLLVTETCWGSVDPAWRQENIRFTLGALRQRQLGFLAHALCQSPVADLHPPSAGPILEDLGEFEFLDGAGQLRPGHAIFNDYCP